MNFEMRNILESKHAFRRELAALPFAEKLRLIEAMRERTLAIMASRRKSLEQPESVPQSDT